MIVQVIRAVFEYIHIMRSSGPQEWFYKEMQLTEDNSFRWKEKVGFVLLGKQLVVSVLSCGC